MENVIIVAEYTCHASSEVGAHLKPKKILFDKILEGQSEFVHFLRQQFPNHTQILNIPYHDSQLIVKLIYCSRYDFDHQYKDNVPGPVYLDYPEVRYFQTVTDATGKSARFELLHFLGVDFDQLGSGGIVETGARAKKYGGSILPEAHSHFPNGYSVVTFYADPKSLLQRVYVLRRDGWRDSQHLYQRLISKAKIEAIRAYLKKEQRVFINNVIVTLPPEVKPLDSNGTPVDASKLTSNERVFIQLPDRPNSIGIIDGQHRVFAYHETVDDDLQIAQLRGQQNLLITGIIFPKGISDAERQRFEAQLFLEINSNQTSAKSDLKQAVGLLLDPFTSESIATKVLERLSEKGPLRGKIEARFYETDKLKPASIISFGLKPLVKLSGSDSLFSIWQSEAKDELAAQKNFDLLDEYVDFCVETINSLLIAISKNLSSGRWTTDPKDPKRVLTTTYLNGFLITMRLLIDRGLPLDVVSLEKRLKQIDTFPFTDFRSSQYNRMAVELVDQFFMD